VRGGGCYDARMLVTGSFIAAAAAPPITIQLPTATTVVLSIIAGLLAVIAYFLNRELKNNDQAHRELRADVETVESDVEKLLAGDVAWVRALLDRTPR